MSFTATTSQATFLFRRIDCFTGIAPDASDCHAGVSHFSRAA